MPGIVGYGAFIPRNRIRSEEIARQWGKDPAAIQRGLLLKEKSVPGLDEDTITISVAAGRGALGQDTDRSGPHPSGRRAEPRGRQRPATQPSARIRSAMASAIIAWPRGVQ